MSYLWAQHKQQLTTTVSHMVVVGRVMSLGRIMARCEWTCLYRLSMTIDTVVAVVAVVVVVVAVQFS